MIRALSVAILLSLQAVPTVGTTPPAHPRYVVVDSSVRQMLADAWDDTNPHQHERAYCLAWVVSARWGVPVYRVWAAAPADVDTSTPNTITYRCPMAPQAAVLHTHPGTTCEVPWACRMGGPDAYQCFESPVDDWTLLQSGQPFAVVQCDRWALVPYFPRPPADWMP